MEESLSYFSLSSVEAGGESTLTASSVSCQQGVVFHVQDQQQDQQQQRFQEHFHDDRQETKDEMDEFLVPFTHGTFCAP